MIFPQRLLPKAVEIFQQSYMKIQRDKMNANGAALNKGVGTPRALHSQPPPIICSQGACLESLNVKMTVLYGTAS